jgi:CRP-like cAMP-binding protein
MLDGQGRTAHGVADGPTTVYALTRNALERLAVEDPALSARLNANIALHLSERLRHALAAWRMASS